MGLGDGDCMIYIVLQLLCSSRVFIFLLESLSFSSLMVQVVCFSFPSESFFWRVSDQWICMYAFFVLFHHLHRKKSNKSAFFISQHTRQNSSPLLTQLGFDHHKYVQTRRIIETGTNPGGYQGTS